MINRYHATRYLTSVHEPGQLPADAGWEVAFAGRSNTGKSSALNVLTEQKSLARISKTPGRTQAINFFLVAPERRLVDLPGYGYAKVPDALRRRWQTLLEGYLGHRRALRGLFLLMDLRHPLTPLDRQLLDWCVHRGLPGHILLTKADKLSRGPALATLQRIQHTLRPHPRISVQLFSALTRLGVEEARQRLDEWLEFEPL
ncbi:MAG: ribosome biogenesis GTP-binding protein YihA/YsxC [Pseudomonadota bacterium]|nr:ribosome biogenesis GTP-binding protein YihA/YsxC [Pseudomonadota bacterium]